MPSLLSEDTALSRLAPPEYDPIVLAECVYRIWSENNDQGEKAGAEKWTSLGPFRRLLVQRVANTWAQRTNEEVEWFPFTEDAVTRIYLQIRKMDKGRKELLRREVFGS